MRDGLPRPPWPAERYPTPTELRDYFLELSPHQQETLAEDFVNDNEVSMRCFEQNHAARLNGPLTAAARRIERLRRQNPMNGDGSNYMLDQVINVLTDLGGAAVVSVLADEREERRRRDEDFAQRLEAINRKEAR